MFAGWNVLPAVTILAANPTALSDGYSGAYQAEVSYTAGSGISQGSVMLGDLNTLQNRASYIGTFWRSENYSLLAGLDWQRFSFGLPSAAPLPNTLQSTSLRLGNEWGFAENWTLRLEVEPGVYSDFHDITGEDFNAPFSARLTYAPNQNVSWIVGLNVNLWSDIPVVGGLGVRWRIVEAWTLSLILPRPRVEFKASDVLTLHAGAELKGGTYRVAEDFGRHTGLPALDGEIVDYREIRAGGGLRWRLHKNAALAAEAGWTIDRRFNFDDQNLQLNGRGAPYIQFSINGTY